MEWNQSHTHFYCSPQIPSSWTIQWERKNAFRITIILHQGWTASLPVAFLREIHCPNYCWYFNAHNCEKIYRRHWKATKWTQRLEGMKWDRAKWKSSWGAQVTWKSTQVTWLMPFFSEPITVGWATALEWLEWVSAKGTNFPITITYANKWANNDASSVGVTWKSPAPWG